jgi:hypothetical protein
MYYKISGNGIHQGFFVIFLATIILFSIIPISYHSVYAAKKSRYDAGWNHGCDDADSGEGHPYLDEKGGDKSHTKEFIHGYWDGYNYCSSQGSRAGGGGGSFGSGARPHSHTSSLVGKVVCNFAKTKPTSEAAGAAALLGYAGLDTAVRALCTARQ